MAVYIHLFDTEENFNTVRSENYYEPWVSYTEDIERVDYNKPDYSKLPLTFEILGSGNITWALEAHTVQYSKNGGNWENMDSSTTLSVVQGDEIRFKGTNSEYCGKTISSTAQFNVKGNIMSLTNSDGFETATTVSTRGFRMLFASNTGIVSAEDLVLPATTLGDYCYHYMFQACTNLTSAPKLPATTLASGCYNNMFLGCVKLTKAPVLPATALTSYCYTAMFRGCSNIAYIKAMFVNLTPTNAVTNWVNAVSASGTFVKNASATWTTTGNNGVPTGWTVETATE